MLKCATATHSIDVWRSVCHAAHHVPREALQVETLAELGGDDQLPQPWVAALLPFEKLRSDIDANGFRGEPGFLGWREALSLAMYRPCARQCPVTRLLEYVTRTEQC